MPLGSVARSSHVIGHAGRTLDTVEAGPLAAHRSLATSYLFSAAFEPSDTPPVAPRET